MPEVTARKTSSTGFFFALTGFTVGAFTLCLFFFTGADRSIGLPCSTNAVDGTLKFRGTWAYVVDPNNRYYLLANPGGTKSQSYVGPINELRRLGEGASLRAEFCGATLVLLSSRGPVFKRTQDAIDAGTSVLRQVFLSISIFFFCVAFLGLFKMWLERRASKGTLP